MKHEFDFIFSDAERRRSLFVAAAVAGAAVAGVAGSAIQGSAAQSAAGAQSAAAQAGINAQLAMFNQTQQNLLPFLQFGQTYGVGTLEGTGPTSLNALTKPWQPTMEQLASTPGYQFTLQQGEQAVANGLSAQGLASNNTPGAVSGPGQKAAINYAEGLASTTYNQQLQNYLQQNQQIYNMLMGVTGQGANAGAGLGGFATQTGQGIANLLGAQGAAQAAGTIGSANAAANGLNVGGNSLMTAALLNQMGLFNGGTALSNGSIGVPNSAGGGSNVA